MRGQPDNANVNNNASLLNDLDSIRLLFNEKEKELAMAVAKVDELTAQLEELRSQLQQIPFEQLKIETQ